MKEILVDELKQIQLQMLDFVSAFCNANNIQYWLSAGTLLGAVRHNGYIPWDDDIDIGMLRVDYERFMRLFNGVSDIYLFKCVENDKNFPCPFGKVLDTRTVLYEPDEATGKKLNVYIDIFVYDNAPNNNKKVAKMFKLRNKYIKLSNHRHYHLANKWYTKIAEKILRILPETFFERLIMKNSKKYAKKECSRVGTFCSFAEAVWDKNIVNSYTDIEFEGKTYKAPIGYDKWLSIIYGDYMNLPPIDQQISNHTFKAYWLDN